MATHQNLREEEEGRGGLATARPVARQLGGPGEVEEVNTSHSRPRSKTSLLWPRDTMLLLAILMNVTSLVISPTAATIYQLDSGGRGGGGGGVRSCSSRDQRDILASIPECRVRETLVDLRPYYANRSDVVEVIPSHALLRRCGGGCHLPPHTCQAVAGRRQTRSLEVMLVLGIWPHGEHEVVCTRLELEEDRECECECAVREHHCRRGSQYYDPSSCRCICSDAEARSQCLRNNMIWDTHSCSCSCPAHTWQACSTGYVFDFTRSCSCVQISLIASKGMVAALVLVIATVLATIVGGILMYRRGTGIFGSSKSPTVVVTGPEVKQRTRLMTQRSRSEFDLVSTLGKVSSIQEFDQARLAQISERSEGSSE